MNSNLLGNVFLAGGVPRFTVPCSYRAWDGESFEEFNQILWAIFSGKYMVRILHCALTFIRTHTHSHCISPKRWLHVWNCTHYLTLGNRFNSYRYLFAIDTDMSIQWLNQATRHCPKLSWHNIPIHENKLNWVCIYLIQTMSSRPSLH